MRNWFIGVVVMVSASQAQAALVDVSTVGELYTAVEGASPGDEIVLAAGTYTLDAPLVLEVAGTSGSSVTLRSADGTRAVLNETADIDVLTIASSTYVTIEGLEITGGRVGVAITLSDYITIADCIIHDTNDFGIQATGTTGTANEANTYLGLIIRNNEIYDTGAGFISLGCATGSDCIAVSPFISENYLHDSPSVGIEVLRDSYSATIRDNVIHDVATNAVWAFGTTGGTFNVIERNAIWSTNSFAINVNQGAYVRNNVIIGTAGGVLMAQIVAGAQVSHIFVFHNTIVGTGTALSISMTDEGGNVVIGNNALYADASLIYTGAADKIFTVANIGAGVSSGITAGMDTSGVITDDFVNVAANASALNAFPKTGGRLIAAGDASYKEAVDFNNQQRLTTHDAGAYIYAADGNPGWALQESAKNATATPGDGDSDTPSGDDDGDDSSGDGVASDSDSGDNTPSSNDESDDENSGCAAVGASWLAMLVGVALTRRSMRRK